MKVSPFELPAPPAATERPSGQRRQTDTASMRTATGDGDDEDDSRDEALDEPGYGHGV